ncbi:Nucleoside diphosphate kinase like protein [Aduncisulcus paluster]|uniref:Nucleoside diphosphate kinase n=1 Tax=Aduncisulcus paluster TaxID=2918883 RepID=A0ABQ5K2X8_9EUKA|nr:Nucleoside diphosphate kinase like protein [Aduncisulcus paluster]|eukprot:gnl/Carplike_NY0171/529_a727_3427.p2 GENE.gnl/Carplike_NY0171/529_a727_3427~~gnl/Carplike_NY0171/529_a727_3427.p2  ORF type:complete len:133 (+),score=48.69 gnl/Carplike_NY0171/529_a727_3427:2-400(+)
MERTFVMAKPDAVSRGLVGKIISTFEARGMKLVSLKVMTPTEEIAADHYAEHKGKGFYPGLISFLTSGPVVPMVFEGKSAISVGRQIIGATRDPAPGSLRGTYAESIDHNVVHGSDAPESAKREMGIWFPEL